MGPTLQPVAFDIETTGFTVDDRVTVAGLALPLGVRLFLNTGRREASGDNLEMSLERKSEVPITISTHSNERALLEALGPFAASNLTDREYLLVGYNGERWRTGFDLPFLRTRLAHHGVAWPFVDLPYADLLPIFERRFQTVDSEGETVADLDGVYDLVLGGDLGELDPFADGEEAVVAYEDGDFEALLAHNLADVRRTAELAAVAERYCGKSDFDLKSLTPVGG